MEETTGGGAGRQFYMLTHEDYAELCNIRAMLIQMAQAAYDEDKPGNGHHYLAITRSEIYFILMAISAQVHNALAGARKGDYRGPRSGRRN